MRIVARVGESTRAVQVKSEAPWDRMPKGFSLQVLASPFRTILLKVIAAEAVAD